MHFTKHLEYGIIDNERGGVSYYLYKMTKQEEIPFRNQKTEEM